MKIETKIKFEPSDFSGSGQYVIPNTYQDGTSDPGYGLSVAYKVGWIHHATVKSLKFNREDGSINCLISLQDGMIVPFGTLESLCEYLNRNNYRPMTTSEIAELVPYEGNRFPNDAG